MFNLISKIQYYHWCLVSRRFFRNLSNQYVYLEPGRYNVTCYHRIYLVKDDISDEYLKMVGINGNRPFFRGFQVKRDNPETKLFCAQMIMSAHGGQRYFNFTNKETFRLFLDKKEYETYKKGITAFKPFFNCPDLQYTEQYCIEKIINNIPRDSWTATETKAIFKTVLCNYINYLSSSSKKNREITEIEVINKTDIKEYTELKKELKDYINNNLMTIPFALCHCDLHFGNTLVDDDNIYLIDFENVREDVFFYDLFNILFVEYVDKDNSYFLDSYLAKETEVENLFQQAFQAVGREFEEKDKVIYFVVFLLSRLTHNVSFLEHHYKGETADRPIYDTVNHVKKVFDYITAHEEKEF